MNPFDANTAAGEAVLQYGDGEYSVIKPGDFVTCAVTGKKIPIEKLKYWNVDKQEAYVDANASMIGFGLTE
ncbi:MAG: DUF2093 domain-containing protein [Marinicaulis sp.]|nr:DUF2093 domain-containing protein [Marinicaulis sp.]NNL90013.1 DUF2093 domain-containing protein [Marinicaulis sp.]